MATPSELKDLGLIEIKTKEELDYYRKKTDMGNGTYNIALTSLKQGVPTFIKVVTVD